MNIEKTIEEKAREYVSLTAINEIYQYAYEGTITIDEAENCIETASIESFKAGAAFALSLNRWRKVSEELPELWQMVLFKVHVFAENYQSQSVTVGRLDTGGYHLQLNDEDILKIEVEEWKPII